MWWKLHCFRAAHLSFWFLFNETNSSYRKVNSTFPKKTEYIYTVLNLRHSCVQCTPHLNVDPRFSIPLYLLKKFFISILFCHIRSRLYYEISNEKKTNEPTDIELSAILPLWNHLKIVFERKCVFQKEKLGSKMFTTQ